MICQALLLSANLFAFDSTLAVGAGAIPGTSVNQRSRLSNTEAAICIDCGQQGLHNGTNSLRIPINVIGRDERETVTDPRELEAFNGVGLVHLASEKNPRATIGARSNPATGQIFLNRGLVLTAAHVFYDDSGNLRSDRIQDFAYSLVNPSTGALETYEIDSVTFGTTTPRQERDKDFAIIKLRQRVPQRINPLGHRYNDADLDQHFPLSTDLRLVGYHSDRGAGSRRGTTLTKSQGTFKEKDPQYNAGAYQRPNYLIHDLDTNGTASGTAITTPRRDGKYTVEALHVGVTNREARLGETFNATENANVAVRIAGNGYFNRKLLEAIRSAPGRVSQAN